MCKVLVQGAAYKHSCSGASQSQGLPADLCWFMPALALIWEDGTDQQC